MIIIIVVVVFVVFTIIVVVIFITCYAKGNKIDHGYNKSNVLRSGYAKIFKT